MKPTRTAAIVQSSYIPWKGYFDLIGCVDRFVFYDVVQYTKNDWRNRNLIKTANGPLWLTIPVLQSNRFGQRIDDVRAANDKWRAKHWRSIEQAYGRAPFFDAYAERFEQLYVGSDERRLSAINQAFTAEIAGCLGIDTPTFDAGDFDLPDDRNDRLVSICLRLGADEYLSGPSARSYLDEARFSAAGIQVRFIDYATYPEYPQLYPPFDHRVTALDLVFNTGPDALSYMLAGSPSVARA